MIGVGIPATTTARGIARVATLADMEQGAVIENGPAFLAAGSEALNAFISACLTGKANTDMDNLTTTGTTKLARYAKPSSNRSIELSMQASPFSITAPGDGTITIRGSVTAAGQNCSIFNVTSSVGRVYVAQGPQIISVDVPCKNGDSITIYHDLRGTFEFFKFIYDEGAY